VDLVLSRMLKRAELVRVENQAAGAELLRAAKTDAYAAPRPVLLALSAQLTGTHVIEDAFANISFAAFVPGGILLVWPTSASSWKKPSPLG
jgi:hypothetical protein